MKISERLLKEAFRGAGKYRYDEEDIPIKNYIPPKLKDIIGLIRKKIYGLDLVNMDKSDRDDILFIKEKLKTIEKMFIG